MGQRRCSSQTVEKGNCVEGDATKDQLDDTRRVCRLRFVGPLKQALIKGRMELLDPTTHEPKWGKGQEAADLEQKLKCTLTPEPWFTAHNCFKPDPYEHFCKQPNCELHSLILGTFGDHYVDSVFHAIDSTLRHPDLVKAGQQKPGQPPTMVPIISNEMLCGVYRRVTKRLTAYDAATCMVTCTHKYAKTFCMSRRLRAPR